MVCSPLFRGGQPLRDLLRVIAVMRDDLHGPVLYRDRAAAPRMIRHITAGAIPLWRFKRMKIGQELRTPFAEPGQVGLRIAVGIVAINGELAFVAVWQDGRILLADPSYALQKD